LNPRVLLCAAAKADFDLHQMAKMACGLEDESGG
jgi:hypothetical protein